MILSARIVAGWIKPEDLVAPEPEAAEADGCRRSRGQRLSRRWQGHGHTDDGRHRGQQRQADDGADTGEGPLRTCVVTRAELPQADLIRFVADPDGVIVPDLAQRLPGRGVWVTASRVGGRGRGHAQGLRPQSQEAGDGAAPGLPPSSMSCSSGGSPMR